MRPLTGGVIMSARALVCGGVFGEVREMPFWIVTAQCLAIMMMVRDVVVIKVVRIVGM